MSERDGNWIDKEGHCKVCDGEIPLGHTADCDILKLERELVSVKDALNITLRYAQPTFRDDVLGTTTVSDDSPVGIVRQALGVRRGP